MHKLLAAPSHNEIVSRKILVNILTTSVKRIRTLMTIARETDNENKELQKIVWCILVSSLWREINLKTSYNHAYDRHFARPINATGRRGENVASNIYPTNALYSTHRCLAVCSADGGRWMQRWRRSRFCRIDSVRYTSILQI